MSPTTNQVELWSYSALPDFGKGRFWPRAELARVGVQDYRAWLSPAPTHGWESPLPVVEA